METGQVSRKKIKTHRDKYSSDMAGVQKGVPVSHDPCLLANALGKELAVADSGLA